MEAPEKIYLHPTSIGTMYKKEVQGLNLIEYTRTDVFIEKACEFLKDRIEHDSIDYPMVTMHLINDFKNYMKG